MMPMERRLRGASLLVTAVLALSLVSEAGAALRDRAEKHDLLIGTAVRFFNRDADTEMVSNPFRDDPRYTPRIAKEFNLVTPENVMKMDTLQPQRGTFDFSRGDELLAFAEQNGMGVRGHTLVWQNQQPAWFANGEWDRTQTLEILEQHIRGVVEHYAGRVVIWDVVNEAIENDGKQRRTNWSKAGKTYIQKAFKFAREADPDAILCYNDFNHADVGNWQKSKADGVYKMVKKMVRKNVPIDCVGFQMHLDLDSDLNDVASNFERYADLGLHVQITELDIRIQEPASKADLKKQAKIYRKVMNLCLDAASCTAFVTWGFTDLYSWIPQFVPGWGSALLLDENYKSKPAYKKLNKTLK